ncbi:MAG: hypothetical protein Ct9H300mP7_2080 [Verrucomicrobiota bacterium]|nr:MAG: hypothetical protein Ct9H300mP7_2080 [Verrucomicrobiota bacterium]
MQLPVPEISDLSSEPQHILNMYGADDSKNKVRPTMPRTASSPVA